MSFLGSLNHLIQREKFSSYISLIFQSGYSSNKKVIMLKFISDVETHRSYEYYATCWDIVC